MLFYYIKEILTTLLPLRIILPSRRLFSSFVSSTSSRTRFIYSSYPKSLPSICLPSFKRSSSFWFTAFSRTSNGKDMAEGKENTLFKTIPYLLESIVKLLRITTDFKTRVPKQCPGLYDFGINPRIAPSKCIPIHWIRLHVPYNCCGPRITKYR
jgi:hypothetical protein